MHLCDLRCLKTSKYEKREESISMSKKNTIKKIVAAGVTVGTAMHLANKYIMKYSTAKDLLKKDDGKFYSFKYGDIFYKVSGDGKPVLLIHDINECSSGIEWFYLEKKLAKTHKVYTIDLLGCGRSDKPKLVYNSFLYIQLIEDFIKDIVGEKTDIIATGNSAAAAVMAAKISRELIDRIILINPADLVEMSDVPDTFSKIMKGIISCPVIGTFAYHMLHRKDDIYNLFSEMYFSDPEGDFEELSEYYYESAHRNESASRYLYASMIGGYLNMNIYHALEDLKNEIVIISGEDFYESDYVPDEYAEINEDIECVSILGTSYLPQLEASSKLAEIIQNYWE